MKSIKAFYDGNKIRLIHPLPKDLSKKKSYVILTFLEEEHEGKVPKGVKEGIIDLVKDRVFDLHSVLDEI